MTCCQVGHSSHQIILTTNRSLSSHAANYVGRHCVITDNSGVCHLFVTDDSGGHHLVGDDDSVGCQEVVTHD